MESLTPVMDKQLEEAPTTSQLSDDFAHYACTGIKPERTLCGFVIAAGEEIGSEAEQAFPVCVVCEDLSDKVLETFICPITRERCTCFEETDL